jgi:7-carboxy-7-deazaguanine synthase (Cx14CxxC type)
MTYKLKESFLTIQGEGAQAGRLSVFLRFTGCNNWSGRAQDREAGPADCARWCDTDFVGTDGDGGGLFTLDELVARVRGLWPAHDSEPAAQPYVVLTGGEPALQIDQPLIDALHANGAQVAIETNGSIALPQRIDWVCVSPKRLLDGRAQALIVDRGQELKVVQPQDGLDRRGLEAMAFEHFFVQPMDGPTAAASLAFCIDWVRRYPRWRLSLQHHKHLGIR